MNTDLLLACPRRCSFVNLTAFALTDSYDGDRDGLIFHAIDQTETRRSQFDLIVMLKPVQRISGNARRLKSLSQLLLELLSNGAAKFLPFLQCRGQKLKIIGHQGLHAPELR